MPGTFPIGSFVKHKQNDYFVSQIVEELTSVPPGEPSLYRCVPLKDICNYRETDLQQVDLAETELYKNMIE